MKGGVAAVTITTLSRRKRGIASVNRAHMRALQVHALNVRAQSEQVFEVQLTTRTLFGGIRIADPVTLVDFT